MKTITALLLLLAAAMPARTQCVSNDPTQPCCNGLIHTWPPAAVNTERPDLLNRFNWTDPVLNTYHPAANYGGNNIPLALANPFYTQHSALQHINFYRFPLQMNNPDSLDFHPQDGWELIHRHLGYLPDEQTLVTDPLDNRIGPYFILYNKYTGLLRLLASFDFDPQDKILANLKFKRPTAGTSLSPSGLLMLNGASARALDKATDDIRLSKAAPFAAGKGFFVADFTLAYDPCICTNESELEIKFSLMNTASAYMEGRLLGTAVPLNGSGNSPLLNDRDFLLAVKRDGFTVEGGALTYNNIDSLVARFKASPAPLLGLLEKQALVGLGAALKASSVKGDKWLNGALSPLVRSIINDFGADADSTFNLGLNAFSQGSAMFVKQITPQAPNNYVPNIQFIEAEMALSGTISDPTELNNGDILLKTPGSKNSQQPTVPWKNYPAYNEALGLFAMLETPKVLVQQGSYGGEYMLGDMPHYNVVYNSSRFQLLPLKYTFNPAAGVDLENTRIFVSLETDLHHEPQGLKGDFRPGFFSPVGGNPFTVVTDYFPVNCFQQMAPMLTDSSFLVNNNIGGVHPNPPPLHPGSILINQGVDNGDPKFGFDFGPGGGGGFQPQRWSASFPLRLKILIEYTFLPNSYGKVHKTLQMLTYPVEIYPGQPALPSQEEYKISYNLYEVGNDPIKEAAVIPIFFGYNIPGSVPSPSEIAPPFVVLGERYFLNSQTIDAWNSMLVNGKLHTPLPGTQITLRAGKEVILKDGAVITAETVIETGMPEHDSFRCDDATAARPAPQNAEQVKAFCSSSVYQAGNFAFKRADSTATLPKQAFVKTSQVKLYPNPSSQDFNIGFELLQDGDIAFSIMDIHARLLHSEKFTGYSKGVYQLPVHSSLAAGMYLVQVTLNGHTELHKLIISR